MRWLWAVLGLGLCGCETGLEGSTVLWEEPCREGTTYCGHRTMARCEESQWLAFLCVGYCSTPQVQADGTRETFSHSCDAQGENPDPIDPATGR
jgi:hypothetical protein